VTSAIHLQAEIERVRKYTSRPRSRKLRAAHVGRDQESLETGLESMTKRDWWSTGRRAIWR
jgi:hypothetical protein